MERKRPAAKRRRNLRHLSGRNERRETAAERTARKATENDGSFRAAPEPSDPGSRTRHVASCRSSALAVPLPTFARPPILVLMGTMNISLADALTAFVGEQAAALGERVAMPCTRARSAGPAVMAGEAPSVSGVRPGAPGPHRRLASAARPARHPGLDTGTGAPAIIPRRSCPPGALMSWLRSRFDRHHQSADHQHTVIIRSPRHRSGHNLAEGARMVLG